MADIDVIRGGYTAFIGGDMVAVRGLFTDDATWVVTGQGPLSGTKRGPDEILAYFGTLMTLSNGTFHVALSDLANGDDHVVSIQKAGATREGASLDQTGIIVWQVQDGHVLKATQFFDDTTVNDAFWR